MTRNADTPWPPRLTPEEHEEAVAAVDSLAELVTDPPPPVTGWWRRREVTRHLDERLREVGRRVVLGQGAAVLLDPGLREEMSEIRRLWRELHLAAEPGCQILSARELATAVDELRRRFEGIERLLRGPATDSSSRAAARATRPRLIAARATRRSGA